MIFSFLLLEIQKLNWTQKNTLLQKGQFKKKGEKISNPSSIFDFSSLNISIQNIITCNFFKLKKKTDFKIIPWASEL